MNRSTFTSKSGLTATATILATIAGAVTHTIDPITAIQQIVAAASVFFIRDAITTTSNAAQEAANNAVSTAVMQARADANAQAMQQRANYTREPNSGA